MESPNSPRPEALTGAWKVSIAVAGAVGLILLASSFSGGNSGRSSSPAPTASSFTDYSPSKSSTPKADAFVAGSGAYMDAREKQLYEQDPSSRGYTDADRDFLKEHGVTEDEARAAETILHEQGIE